MYAGARAAPIFIAGLAVTAGLVASLLVVNGTDVLVAVGIGAVLYVAFAVLVAVAT